jgi:hypothetical protein
MDTSHPERSEDAVSAKSDAVSAATLVSISTPDRVDTRIGTLEFFDALPSATTIEVVYDNLDLLRGVEVFLRGIPAASLYAMREGQKSVGVERSNQIAAVDRMTSASIYLTANTDTSYGSAFLDLKDFGPTVVEVPPNSLGFVNDFWFRWVGDLGAPGPDRGAGGKYLVLPPGWSRDTPEGYFTYMSRTYTNWVLIRSLDGLDAMQAGLRVYPLSASDDPTPTEFVSISGLAFNTVHANDFHFFEEVDAVVQEEPLEALDPETRGLLASIGIVKDRPFAPDARMRALLVEAAAIGNATARAIFFKPRDPRIFYYPDSSWKMPSIENNHEFLVDGARLLDGRTLYYYVAAGISPAMTATPPGVGSRYAWTAEDADGSWLDGGKRYRLRLPVNIPARNFWSVAVYDTQSRSLLRTDSPYPSLNDLTGTVQPNPDGSTDVVFGPEPPEGREANWIQTIPGKSWFTILRLYGPLEPWFDKTWRPGEIEAVP